MSINENATITQSDEAFDRWMAEALAKSESAVANYARTVHEIGRQIGDWYDVPPKIASWVKYRAGHKTSPVAQAEASRLRQQGWVDAPRGLKCHGFEVYDIEEGLYLVAPQEVYRRMLEIAETAVEMRAGMRRAVESEAAGLEQSGVSIDTVSFKVDEMSVDDAANKGREAAAVARARRLSKRSE